MNLLLLPAVHSLAEARQVWADFTAIISIEDVGVEEDRSFRLPSDVSRPPHLRLAFDDIDEPVEGYVGATAEQVTEALEFARKHHDKRLLVHCHSGQCRSAALALGIIAERFGMGHEDEAVAKLLEIRPIAAPNLIVLALLDQVLARGGALESAWLRHEQNQENLLRLRFLRKAYYSSEASRP